MHRVEVGGALTFLKGYSYDGLGRLIRTQSPYPDAENAEGGNRIERFYYDGVRRIQEVVIDPASSLGEALTSGSSEMQSAALQSQQSSGVSNAALNLEEEATPVGVEAEQMNSGESSNSEGGTFGTTVTYVEREYIWGPGDGWGGGGAGVDELVAQFDRTGAMTFALMDAGGDCVALCDAGASGGTARVVGQWVYDAYGNVMSADHLYPHAYSHVGHKGLFIDRLDVGVADHGEDSEFEPGMFVGHASCEFDVPRVVPFGRSIYQNRNRAYMPNIGRFAQADPNASGVGVLDLPLHHGIGFSSMALAFDVESRYGNSGSLFAYLDCNPSNRQDPMGLFFFDMALKYAEIGFAVGRIGHGLVSVYSENLDFDADWAADWTQPDDWHSRGDASWIRNVYRDANINGLVDDQLDPTGGLIRNFVFASTTSTCIEVASLLTSSGRRAFTLAKKMMQFHHVLPRYFRYIIGKSSNFLVHIPTKLHRAYHNYVSRGMQARLPGCPAFNAGQTKWEKWVKEFADKYYGGDKSKVVSEVKDMLQRLTDEFGHLNDIPGLGDTLRGLL